MTEIQRLIVKAVTFRASCVCLWGVFCDHTIYDM